MFILKFDEHLNLDFRGYAMNGNQSGSLFAISRKKPAQEFARRCGWNAKDVCRARNQFFMFWVVGQSLGEHKFRCLANDGTWIDFVCDWDARQNEAARLNVGGEQEKL